MVSGTLPLAVRRLFARDPGETAPASDAVLLAGSALLHLALFVAASLWLMAPTPDAGRPSRSPGIAITLVDSADQTGARQPRSPAAGQQNAAAAAPATPTEQAEPNPSAPTGGARTAAPGTPVDSAGMAGGPAAATGMPSASGSAPGASAAAYLKALTEHIRGFRRYPALPGNQRPAGLVRLGIVVSRSGQVKQLWTVTGSGYGALDNAAMETVWRAAPLPAIPPHLPDELELIVPIDFEKPG